MKKILKNSIVSSGANAIYLVSRLLITPIILHFVLLEEFALWSITFVIISYIGLSGSGIGNAFITYSARYYRDKRLDEINKLIVSGTIFLLILSSLIYVVLWLYLDFFISIFDIGSLELVEVAKNLILGTTLVFLFELSFEAFENFLEGIQEIALTRTIWIIGNFLEIALALILLNIGFGIYSLLYAYGIKALFKVITHYFYLRRYIKLSLDFSIDILKEIFDFAARVQVLSIIGIIMTTFNQLVVAKILGLYETGLFELGRKLPQKGQSVIAGSFISFMPAATEIYKDNRVVDKDKEVKSYIGIGAIAFIISMLSISIYYLYTSEINPSIAILLFFLLLFITSLVMYIFKHYKYTEETIDNEALRSLYLEGSKNILILEAFIFSFMLIFAKDLLYIWLGRSEVRLVTTMMIFIISIFVNLATGVGTSMMRGIERVSYEIEYAILNLILAIVWIIMLTKLCGIVGAALGTALSTIFASIYFIYRLNKILVIKKYFNFVYKIPVTFFFIGILVYLFGYYFNSDNRWLALIILAVKLVVYILLDYLVLKYIFKVEELIKVEEKIKRIFAKS